MLITQTIGRDRKCCEEVKIFLFLDKRNNFAISWVKHLTLEKKTELALPMTVILLCYGNFTPHDIPNVRLHCS